MLCLLTIHPDLGIWPEGGSRHPVGKVQTLKPFVSSLEAQGPGGGALCGSGRETSWGAGFLDPPSRDLLPVNHLDLSPPPLEVSRIIFYWPFLTLLGSPDNKNILSRKALPGQGNSMGWSKPQNLLTQDFPVARCEAEVRRQTPHRSPFLV